VKVPEKVLERFEEVMAGGSWGSPARYPMALEAALEKLREELEGKSAIGAGADRLAGSGSEVDDLHRSYAREAVRAAVSSVLGGKEGEKPSSPQREGETR